MKVTLPSGAELEIALAPFKDARALQKVVAEEAKGIKITSAMQILEPQLIKEVFCSALSSDKLEAAIWVCAKRCTYKGVKITEDTFEEEEARGDYNMLCYEIAKANLLPFLKGLSFDLKGIFQAMLVK